MGNFKKTLLRHAKETVTLSDAFWFRVHLLYLFYEVNNFHDLILTQNNFFVLSIQL